MIMDLQIRTIEPAEAVAFVHANEAAFSRSPAADELEVELSVMEPDRSHAAFDAGAIVGCAAVATFRMTVPGAGPLAVAGVTGVGVLPTHRRRGVNTALMRAQLDDVHAHGESVAVLYASEGGIYGRFGYGLASFMGDVNVATERSRFVRGYRPSGAVRLLSHDDAVAPMRGVYDAACSLRPGMIALDDRWWAWRWAELEEHRDTPTFYAVHRSDDGQTDAYAVYRVKHEWRDELPRLELSIEELQATTPQSYADIWRFVLDIDLVDRVRAWNRPLDDPILRLLAEPRQLRFALRDGLWVRLVDVEAALSSRGYRGSGRVRFEIEDDFCPWNEARVTLEVSDGTAVCRTDPDAAPDLRCRVNDVGAAYLGGATFAALQRAGQTIELTSGAIAKADALFAADAAPWCSVPF